MCFLVYKVCIYFYIRFQIFYTRPFRLYIYIYIYVENVSKYCLNFLLEDSITH